MVFGRARRRTNGEGPGRRGSILEGLVSQRPYLDQLPLDRELQGLDEQRHPARRLTEEQRRRVAGEYAGAQALTREHRAVGPNHLERRRIELAHDLELRRRALPLSHDGKELEQEPAQLGIPGLLLDLRLDARKRFGEPTGANALLRLRSWTLPHVRTPHLAPGAPAFKNERSRASVSARAHDPTRGPRYLVILSEFAIMLYTAVMPGSWRRPSLS